MAPRETLLGSATLNEYDTLPMSYSFKNGVVRGLQRVHPKKVDLMFLDRWSEFSFKYAHMTGKKGTCAFDKKKTIVVFSRLLTDREKLELAKQLLGE